MDDPRASLLHDGYAVLRGVLPRGDAARFDALCTRLCHDPAHAELQRDRFTGSLIPVTKDPGFAALVAHGAALRAFRDRFGWGAGSLRWLSGFVISKPPRSPSLAWHQDGWYWDDAVGYADQPAQVFAMYYLTDTSRDNGCLRVLPGTHRAPHPLHRALGAAHSDAVRSGAADDAWRAAAPHSEQPGCVDVAVQAGDVVIGDARVLHGAWPNASSRRRNLVTLWYLPQYTALPARLRRDAAALHAHQSRDVYRGGGWGALRGLLPEGGAAAAAAAGNEYDHSLSFMDRTPGHCAHATPAARRAWAAASAPRPRL